MANTYFQFKKFRVEQDRCGMKVCTDACIQGAYTRMPGAKNILDIGCGTGLLSLMAAQQHPEAWIDAVEIEANAFAQALENVHNSPWADRIKVQNLPVQAFAASTPYDLIICNPPFYPRHLPSPNLQRNQAHHHKSLTFEELAKVCKKWLAPHGACSILLPPVQAADFAVIAGKEGLYAWHELVVAESSTHKPHRSIRLYGQYPKTCSTNTLQIREADNSYSPAFRQLLQPFYTIF